MTQAYLNQIADTSTESGDDLASRLNAFDTAHKTNQAGAARPTGIGTGGLWTKDNGGGSYTLMLYNGASDLALALVDDLGGLAYLDILDEDDMATDSATRPPSQQSVKAYVDRLFDNASVVTGSRSAGTTYNNSTGGPMMVIWRLSLPDGASAVASIGGTPVAAQARSGASGQASISIIVPAGNSYSIALTSATIDQWTEIS